MGRGHDGPETPLSGDYRRHRKVHVSMAAGSGMSEDDVEADIQHLGEVEVSGCAEFWEYMSEIRHNSEE